MFVASGVLACVFIWLFRFHGAPIVPDEIGYLAIANYIVNGEVLNVSITPTYRFGQSILLVPAFIFGQTPAEVYRIAAAVSCVQTALLPVALLAVGRRLGVPTNAKTAAAAFLVAIFPNYFYQTSLAWPEASFRLFFVVSLLLISLSWVSARSWLWLLTFTSIVWLYALHPRAMGILAVAMMLIISARTRRKMTLSTAWASLLLVTGGAYLVHEIQQHFVELLWPGKGGDASSVGMLLEMLASGQSSLRLLTAISGQAWMAIVSSLGLYIFGLVHAVKLVRADQAAAGPPIIFAFWASVAIFGASVLQMAAHLARIDHVIYARYFDGATALFIWLGLVYVLTNNRTRTVTAWIVGLAIGLGGLTILASASFTVATIIDPNMASLLWLGQIVPLSEISLHEVIIYGTGLALLVALVWLAPTALRVVVVVAAVLAGDYFAFYPKQGWHLSRVSLTSANAQSYLPYQGKLYWDRSARLNDNVVFDQFMAINDPLPWSDLTHADIPEGTAAIADGALRKPGYTCAANLNYGLVLLVNGPSSTHCGGLDAPPVVLPLGKPLRFSDVDAVRGLGWSHPEPWGRWTEDSRATLNFILAEETSNRVLEIAAQSYLEGNPPQQRVEVRANSRPLTGWTFTEGSAHQIMRIPVPDGAKELEIEFQFPDARSPQQAGKSADPRLLGIGVGAICLTQADKRCLRQ